MTKNFSSDALFPTLPLPQCKISIVIPVRDEAETLDKTLQAATGQFDFNRRPLDARSFEIIVLANNCTDDSAIIARKWSNRENLPPVHVAEIKLPFKEAHIGRARRILMDEAFRRLSVYNNGNGVIASTDGDTQVAPDWVAANIFEIKQGADAVGGYISIADEELAKLDAPTRRCQADDFEYRQLIAELEDLLDHLPHDASPRHYHHFGASFAVTTETYRRSGGLPVQSSLEDIAFYDLLQRIDLRFRHSPLVRVQTSARRSGRVAVGLSWQLNKWSQMEKRNKPQMVASAAEMANWFVIRQKLRELWTKTQIENITDANEIAFLARQMKVRPVFLRRKIRQSKTFGVLAHAMWLEIKEHTDWNAHFPLSEIKQATTDLRLIICDLKRSVSR